MFPVVPDSIVAAFGKVGIDASFNEDSPDADVQAKVNACKALSAGQRERVIHTLRKMHRKDVEQFVHELAVSLTRSVKSVFVLALHGKSCLVTVIDEAIHFIEQHDESSGPMEFVRYEVNVRYTNGDEIRGTFESKTEAIKFLNSMR